MTGAILLFACAGTLIALWLWLQNRVTPTAPPKDKEWDLVSEEGLEATRDEWDETLEPGARGAEEEKP